MVWREIFAAGKETGSADTGGYQRVLAPPQGGEIAATTLREGFLEFPIKREVCLCWREI
jgi:hypothetical protein